MKRIGFIGDTHCGAIGGGLWPVSWLPGDAPYTGVRYLGQCFDHLVETWPDLDVLFLMGDLIDGKNRKSDGVGVFTTQIGRQVDAAIEVLRPLCAKAKVVMRVWGTPYHEEHHDGLGKLDVALGVERSRQVINLELPTPDGKSWKLNVAHHPPGGGALYMGTKLDKMILWQIIMSALKKIPQARWIVRAHLHSSAQMTRFGRTAALNGCWKLPDAHSIKGNYEQWQPDVGGLILRKDDEHPSGWSFIEHVYDPPTEDEEVINLGELERLLNRLGHPSSRKATRSHGKARRVKTRPSAA